MPPAFVMELMEIEPMPMSFRWFILFLAALNLVVSLMCEKYLFHQMMDKITQFLAKRSFGYTLIGAGHGKRGHDKTYRRVMDEMGLHE